MQPVHESGSLDRISRVRGYTKPTGKAVNLSETGVRDGNHLYINEPVATLLRASEGLEAKLAMALICVTSFISNSSDKQRHISLAVADLPKVKIHLLLAGMAESFFQGDLPDRKDVIPAWQYTASDFENIVNVLFETNGGSKAIIYPVRTPSASCPYRLILN